MRFQGKILLGEDVILPEVSGDIESYEAPGGIKGWKGRFNFPEDGRIDTGKNYLLVLKNGKSIFLTIHHILTGSNEKFVAEFRSKGGWNRP